MLVQAILIGLIAAFGKLDYQLGTLYAFRPIVLCPLVGIVLGDLQSGLAIGASLELLFMGSISIGAYVPPDETIGGVLACAFAIQLGQSTEAAIALAMPIATLCLAIKNVLNAGMPLLVDRADVFAARVTSRYLRYALDYRSRDCRPGLYPVLGLLLSGCRRCSGPARLHPDVRPRWLWRRSQHPPAMASPCSAVWCLPSSSCRSTSWASCCAPIANVPVLASP